MTQHRFMPLSFAASAVLAFAALSPRVALAQSTCVDSGDCGKGFECTVVGGSTCGSAGAAAPAPACPPDDPECAMQDPLPQPEPQPCETTEIKACTPAHCTADTDCSAGMVCYEYTQDCTTPASDCACAPNTPDCSCGATPVPACDPQTISMCTPRYALPCMAAADCGPGFSCEEQQSCGCSGGGTAGKPAPQPEPDPGFAPPEGAGGASSEAPEPPIDPDPMCSCEPSGVFSCVAQELECDATSDCPAGWLCQQEVQPTAPACGGAGCPDPLPLPPARRLCVPEYYSGVGVDQGGVPGTATGTGNNPEDPKAGNANPESAGEGGGEENESAACQMGHAPASSGALSILAMLGALLGLKRRRVVG